MPGIPSNGHSSGQVPGPANSPEPATVTRKLAELEAACVQMESALGWAAKGIGLTDALVVEAKRRRQHDLDVAKKLICQADQEARAQLAELLAEKDALAAEVEAWQKRCADLEQEITRRQREVQKEAAALVDEAHRQAEMMLSEAKARRDAVLRESATLEGLLGHAREQLAGQTSDLAAEQQAPRGGLQLPSEEREVAGRPEAPGPSLAEYDQAPSEGAETQASSHGFPESEPPSTGVTSRVCQVILTGLNAFTPALEFERAVRAMQGVRKVNPIRLQGGTLVLRVQYTDLDTLERGCLSVPGLEIAKEGFDEEGLKLRFVRSSGSQIWKRGTFDGGSSSR